MASATGWGATWSHDDTKVESRFLKAVKAFVEKGNSDPTLGTPHGMSNFVFHEWQGPVESFSWLLRQDHFEVDIQLDSEERSIYHSLASSSSMYMDGATLLLDVLWREENSCEIASMTDQLFETVLHKSLVRLVDNAIFLDLDVLHLRNRPCHALISRLLKAGSNIHAQNIYGHTPLAHMITHILDFTMLSDHPPDRFVEHFSVYPGALADMDTPQEVNNHFITRQDRLGNLIFGVSDKKRLLQWWFCFLLDQGFDLLDYIRVEGQLAERKGVEWALLRSNRYPNRYFKMQVLHDETAQELEITVIFGCTERDEGDMDTSSEWTTDDDSTASDITIEDELEMPGAWVS